MPLTISNPFMCFSCLPPSVEPHIEVVTSRQYSHFRGSSRADSACSMSELSPSPSFATEGTEDASPCKSSHAEIGPHMLSQLVLGDTAGLMPCQNTSSDCSQGFYEVDVHHSAPRSFSCEARSGAPQPGDFCDLALHMDVGDVLMVKNNRISDIGGVGGFMGHVLLVVAAPRLIKWDSSEGDNLKPVFPNSSVWPLWKVRTLESTRRVQGLHEADIYIHIEESTGCILLVGEESEPSTFYKFTDETAEVLQAPPELRRQFRVGLMEEVLRELHANTADWSYTTAARALFMSPEVPSHTDPSKCLQELMECWEAEPICTSIVIVAWQRYLYRFAKDTSPTSASSVVRRTFCAKTICQWMPLKADRALPSALVGTMVRCGWTYMTRVPSRSYCIPGMKPCRGRSQTI